MSGFDRLRGSWPCVLACAATLSLAACQKHGPRDGGDERSSDGPAPADDGGEGGGAGEDGDDNPSPVSKDDRIPQLSAPPAGLAPGYLDGSLLYASARAGAIQQLLQSIPVSPRDAKDIAEVGALFGFDPRIDDVLGHFGIAADARVSLSVRPVVEGASEVASAAAAANSAVGSPIDAELVNVAKALGVHIRVHVPVSERVKLDGMIARLAADMHDDRWATTCASLGPTRACGGESDSIGVVRDVPGGVQLDLLLTYVGDYEQPDSPQRRQAIQQALNMPAASSLPEVAGLAGDAVMLIDAPMMVTAMRTAAVAKVVARMGEYVDEAHGLARLLGRTDAIMRLHETERMFSGVTLEVLLGKDRMLATGRWRPTAYGREHMREVFELRSVDADVPSIASLCDGALMCGRSRGITDRTRFAKLATGVYADPTQLGELLDDYEEEGAALLLLETWPNAIGTLAALPGKSVEPAEAMIIGNVIDIANRVLGFGFSVRSLAETRRSLTGDWVAYARTTASDLAAVRGYMQLGNITLSPANIPDVAGRVDVTPLPEPDVPGNYYSIVDPKAATGEWGWAVVADADDRVRWLASLPRDDGAVPLLYLEIGDLWRMVASFDDGREELGFAQSWLSRRWIRGQVSLDAGGAPELRMAMGKLE